MKTKSLFIYRAILISLVNLIVILGFVCIYKAYYDKMPGTIVLETGKEQVLSYHLPVKGTIYLSEEMEETEYGRETEAVLSSAVTEVDFQTDITFVSSKPQEYVIKTKLFGVIPFKSIDVSVVDEVQIIPLGVPVGVYANTDGLLVVQTGEFEDGEGNEYAPCKDIIFPGDYIMEINNTPLLNKYQLVSIIEGCEGESQKLTIRRGEKTIETYVLPRESETGEYKLGIWVKDNAQGIGTLTYVTGTGEFGALGHGIIDLDIQEILDIGSGNLYKAEILGVKKSRKGTPGEMSGVIFYGQDPLGKISGNYETGIYGQYDLDKMDYLFMTMKDENLKQPMEIAYRNEVKEGAAQILCTINEETRYFDIEIEKIYQNPENVNKSMKIAVTDEELLALTGGIVQGMSGSPIIQNDKVVGAVTHVLINDPRKGYGIFIEEMLDNVNEK